MNEGSPEVGDYIICSSVVPEENVFFSNNIGKIIDVKKYYYYPYNLEYDNVPDNLKKSNGATTFVCRFNDILYFSKDKEELEYILRANKFNI